MKVEIKRLEGTRWHPVPIKNIVGKSICNFMVESEDAIVAALYEGTKKIAIVTNKDKYTDQYKDKIFTISAQDLQKLIGTDTIHPCVAEVFPEAGVANIKVIKE
jgi:hypothetical protein